MIFEGFASRFRFLKGGASQISARFTHQESLAVALVEPQGFEMTRAGRRFYLGYPAAPTGIAPVQAIPTTAAQWAFTNLDPFKTYFYKMLSAFPISGTPGAGGQLLATIFQTPAQTGLATNVAIVNAAGSAMSSKKSVKSGVTITGPAAPVWFPVAENLSANVGAFPGSGLILNRQVDGVICALPPGQSLGLAVLALAGTTPLFVPSAEWLEIETDME